MGFELHGLNPTTAKNEIDIQRKEISEDFPTLVGEYFSATIGLWDYIWGLVAEFCCPDIVTLEDINNGQYNFEYYKISKSKAIKISDILEQARLTGKIKIPVFKVSDQIWEKIKNGGYKLCPGCGGKGHNRLRALDWENKSKDPNDNCPEYIELECPVCDCSGIVAKDFFSPIYHLDPVADFIEFCRQSGGFAID